MLKLPRALQIVLFALLLAALLVSFTIVLRNVMQDNTIGMDFSIYWTAGRAVFLEQQSPYSDELALQNQLRVLRRPSRPDEDQMAFAYPPYALLLSIPTVFLNFDYAQAGWMVFNILALVCAVLIIAPRNFAIGILAVLFLFPFTFGILMGNYVVPIAAILLLALGTLSLDQFSLSPARQIGLGLLLAWVTVKPQFVWLYLVFIAIYALRARYWKLLIAFACGAALFLAISFVFVPGWPSLWLERMGKYSAYVQSYPMATLLLKSFLPLPAAYLLSGILFAGLLALTAVFFRRWWQNQLPLIDLLLWLGLVTYLFHPRNVSYSQIAFLIPFILWLLQAGGWKHPRVWISWLAMIVVSWLVLAVTLAQPENLLLDELRLAFFALWMLWFFLHRLKSPYHAIPQGSKP